MDAQRGRPPLDASALYRVLAESASDAIVTIDQDSVVLSINPAGERLFGYPAAEVIGRGLVTLMPERFRARHREGMGRYLKTRVRNIPWQAIPLPILTRDGREIPVEISFGEFMSEGRLIFSGIIRDVSDRLAAQAALAENAEQLRSQALELEHQVEEAQALGEELEQANQELSASNVRLESARQEAEGASRAKSDFLAVMSHELRTPLNAIAGYAELMELELHGPLSEQQHEDLRRIQQSQRHLLGLINQVLNYTRVESGTLRYDLTDIAVSTALAAAEVLVMPQIRARGLDYTHGACDDALRVRADAEKLQQILLNLLTNAIKFTESGGRITISCATRQDEVTISVTDTGVGIAADKLASVFEPFVQVDQGLTRPHEGVGLGLAISRDLARGMAGDLTAESTPGVGSTFVLTLPIAGGGR
jgi:PAS domain S-box-containing protein